MFDLKAEAEMRLFSEKLARELAGRRSGAREDAGDRATGEPSAADRQLPTPADGPDAAEASGATDAAEASGATEIPGRAKA
ncbi:hypothetical protein [Streptomyces sp. NPDC045470]|uniref:hypothetical protein n=1 Tax=unclassified Streptomyces TaxID=2593676 RepID=UPI0033C27AB8